MSREARRGDAPPPPLLERAAALASRRALSRAEVRDRLLRSGEAPGPVEAALDRLEEAGLVDDARLASALLLSGWSRPGRAPERLLREVERRGIAAGTVRAAWASLVAAGDVDPSGALERETARRLAAAGGALDRRGFARVYNALLRAGFEPEAVEAALAPHRPSDLDA